MPKRYRIGIMQPDEKQDGIARVERLHFVEVDEAQAAAYANGDPAWRNAKPVGFGVLGRAWRRLWSRGP